MRVPRLALVLAGLALLTGCLTAPQVRDIVDESNQQTIALLTASDGVSVAMDGENPDAKNWQQTATRLQSVISENQGNPTIADPLRLRLAYLLLTAKKVNTAEEVWKTIASDAKFSERDKILYEYWALFKWWSIRGDDRHGWSVTDMDTLGPQYRAALFKEAEKEDRDPTIKAWLNYTAARIGYRTAIAHVPNADIRRELKATLEPYGANFSDAEIATFKSLVHVDVQGGQSYLPWAIRAKLVYCDSYGRWVRAAGDSGSFPASDWVTDNLDLANDC